VVVVAEEFFRALEHMLLAAQGRAVALVAQVALGVQPVMVVGAVRQAVMLLTHFTTLAVAVAVAGVLRAALVLVAVLEAQAVLL
jgi:hypothetical protein